VPGARRGHGGGEARDTRTHDQYVRLRGNLFVVIGVRRRRRLT